MDPLQDLHSPGAPTGLDVGYLSDDGSVRLDAGNYTATPFPAGDRQQQGPVVSVRINRGIQGLQIGGFHVAPPTN